MGIRHGEKTILKKISAWESTISKWLADESCVITVICDAFSQDNFGVLWGCCFHFSFLLSAQGEEDEDCGERSLCGPGCSAQGMRHRSANPGAQCCRAVGVPWRVCRWPPGSQEEVGGSGCLLQRPLCHTQLVVALMGLVCPLCAGKVTEQQRAVNLQLERCLGVFVMFLCFPLIF